MPPAVFTTLFGWLTGAVTGVAGAIDEAEEGIGGVAGGVGHAAGGGVETMRAYFARILARARAIYDEWGTIALAWLVVGYIIIIILSILMEASRCAMGLAAFGADEPHDDAKKPLRPADAAAVRPEAAPAPSGAPPGLRQGKPRESFVGQNVSALL